MKPRNKQLDAFELISNISNIRDASALEAVIEETEFNKLIQDPTLFRELIYVVLVKCVNYGMLDRAGDLISSYEVRHNISHKMRSTQQLIMPPFHDYSSSLDDNETLEQIDLRFAFINLIIGSQSGSYDKTFYNLPPLDVLPLDHMNHRTIRDRYIRLDLNSDTICSAYLHMLSDIMSDTDNTPYDKKLRCLTLFYRILLFYFLAPEISRHWSSFDMDDDSEELKVSTQKYFDQVNERILDNHLLDINACLQALMTNFTAASKHALIRRNEVWKAVRAITNLLKENEFSEEEMNCLVVLVSDFFSLVDDREYYNKLLEELSNNKNDINFTKFIELFVRLNYRDIPSSSVVSLYKSNLLDMSAYFFVVLESLITEGSLDEAEALIEKTPVFSGKSEQAVLQYYSATVDFKQGYIYDARESLRGSINLDPHSPIINKFNQTLTEIEYDIQKFEKHVAALRHAFNFVLTARQKKLLIILFQLGDRHITMSTLTECTNIRESELKKQLKLLSELDMIEESRTGYRIDEFIVKLIEAELQKEKTNEVPNPDQSSKGGKAKRSSTLNIRVILKSGREGNGMVTEYHDLKSFISFLEKTRKEGGDELLVFEDFAFRPSEVAWIETVDDKN